MSINQSAFGGDTTVSTRLTVPAASDADELISVDLHNIAFSVLVQKVRNLIVTSVPWYNEKLTRDHQKP